MFLLCCMFVFFFKQKTAYELRISDWSSDVCSSDLSLWMAGGRYIDRLERRDGEWKIALRTNLIEWSCMPPPMPLPFADLPDIAANGVSSRSKDDPSYQRPLTNKRKAQKP